MKDIDRIGSFRISILRHTDYHFKLEKLPNDIEDSLQDLLTWINGNSTNLPANKVHGTNMGPSGADRTQVGPMLAPWTLLSGQTVVLSLFVSKERISFIRQKRPFRNVMSSLLTNVSCLSYIRGGRDLKLPPIVSNRVSKHDFRTFILMIQL